MGAGLADDPVAVAWSPSSSSPARVPGRDLSSSVVWSSSSSSSGPIMSSLFSHAPMTAMISRTSSAMPSVLIGFRTSSGSAEMDSSNLTSLCAALHAASPPLRSDFAPVSATSGCSSSSLGDALRGFFFPTFLRGFQRMDRSLRYMPPNLPVLRGARLPSCERLKPVPALVRCCVRWCVSAGSSSSDATNHVVALERASTESDRMLMVDVPRNLLENSGKTPSPKRMRMPLAVSTGYRMAVTMEEDMFVDFPDSMMKEVMRRKKRWGNSLGVDDR